MDGARALPEGTQADRGPRSMMPATARSCRETRGASVPVRSGALALWRSLYRWVQLTLVKRFPRFAMTHSLTDPQRRQAAHTPRPPRCNARGRGRSILPIYTGYCVKCVCEYRN